jgi:nucleoside-diphosphate-sugar epimerase
MGLNLSRGSSKKYYSSDRIAQLMGNGLLTFIDKKTKLNEIINSNEAVFYKDVNDLIKKAITDKYIIVYEGHFRRNFIHIKDVISAFKFFIENDEIKNETFNLGNTKLNMSKNDLCLILKKYFNNLYIHQTDLHNDPDKRDYIVSNKKIEKLGYKAQFDIKFAITEIKKYLILNKSNILNSILNVLNRIVK